MPSRTSQARSGLLRFITAGSVDDGKSTLIGRLLYDSKGLHTDQLSALEAASRRRGFAGIDLSLLTDGLVAEREQGITIDVAYRYFGTPERKFIIGDSPGHVQYTRNMVTAASTADVAVLLVDARKGVVAQTRRHACIAHWIGIPRLVLAVNKMDAVDWELARFEAIRADFETFARGLHFADVVAIPMSALLGDMVVERGNHLGAYAGPTLLEHLVAVPARHEEAGGAMRFPVQRVVRVAGGNLQPGASLASDEFRGYQGTVASGRISVDDEIVVLPGTGRARVAELVTADGPLAFADADTAVTIRLDRDLDLARGDVLATPAAPPRVGNELDADLCWFDSEPLSTTAPYLIKHATATIKARFTRIANRIDVETLELEPAPSSLTMNDLARVSVRLQRSLAFDPYRENRWTGAFIVIEPTTNRTVGAGTIA